MKDSIANVWLLGIVMLFILMFSAYIAVTVDYSQTFKLKNTVLTIIEKDKGISFKVGSATENGKVSGQTVVTDAGTIQTINLYLMGNAYTAKGPCPDDGAKWVGIKKLSYTDTQSEILEYPPNGDEYYYCISAYKTGQSDIKFAGSYGGQASVYYKVRLFYKMEFPVISEFLQVKVEGMTDEVYRPINTDVLVGSSGPYGNIINNEYFS